MGPQGCGASDPTSRLPQRAHSRVQPCLKQAQAPQPRRLGRGQRRGGQARSGGQGPEGICPDRASAGPPPPPRHLRAAPPPCSQKHLRRRGRQGQGAEEGEEGEGKWGAREGSLPLVVSPPSDSLSSPATKWGREGGGAAGCCGLGLCQVCGSRETTGRRYCPGGREERTVLSPHSGVLTKGVLSARPAASWVRSSSRLGRRGKLIEQLIGNGPGAK